jgi:hypothetical protein
VIAGKLPSLRGVHAVISASESSHPAHAAGHALALRAAAAGLRTYALQHGFENVGLFGFEAAAASFASEVVFCWFPESADPPGLPPGARARLAHVGRPAPVIGKDAVEAFDVGVFENLHWERYSDENRHGFVQGLKAAAAAHPRLSFRLRPHPAGGWADQLGHELAPLTNITLDSAERARARLEGGAEVVRGLGRVITTPSTVALDAAMAGLPTAIAAGDDLYDPLPRLAAPEDWIAFAGGRNPDPGAADRFLARVLTPGDGAARIAERLSCDLSAPEGAPDA